MNLYVCEQYDCTCGIFSTLTSALSHMESCRACSIQEYDLDGTEYKRTRLTISHVRCENCGKCWRSDTAPVIKWDGSAFCSPNCVKETQDFVEAGFRGIYGSSTREVKQRIREATAKGEDPYKGCFGRYDISHGN